MTLVKSLCFECFDWQLTLGRYVSRVVEWIDNDQCWRCEPYGVCDACGERQVTIELAVVESYV